MPKILYEEEESNGLFLTVFEPMRNGSVLQIEDVMGNAMYFGPKAAKEISDAILQALNPATQSNA